jgi:hypothetical protein
MDARHLPVGLGIVLMLVGALIMMSMRFAASASPPFGKPKAILLVKGLEGGAGSTMALSIAVPVGQLKQQEGKIVLPGATKDALKAAPKFEYTK